MIETQRTEESTLKYNLNINITIDINEPGLKNIIKAFVETISSTFEKIVEETIRHYAQLYLENGTLEKLLKCNRITKKTFTGIKKTKISTPFGLIKVPQLQIKLGKNGKRMNITRLLLGIERWKRIPAITEKYFGLIGALAPLRVVNKILQLFTGTFVSLMTIVRSIRNTAKTIEFGIDKNETNEFEADGTGMPILNSGKRGKELEILAQRTKKGRIRIAGMIISGYKKGWKELFKSLRKALKSFKKIFLITDGDTSPLKGLKGIKVILQRCLFHIGHEIKYTLWQDKVKRKSEEWKYILANTLDITNVKRIREEPDIGKIIIKRKKKQLDELIIYCKEKKYKKTMKYLKKARDDIFSGIERKILGGTTSLIERVMRTINQRINIAKWSAVSALSVAKIRGAYYYNGFDI